MEYGMESIKPSSDLQKRLSKAARTQKAHMNRTIILQLVKARLEKVVSEELRELGLIEANQKLELDDTVFREFVVSFTPYFEICSLCRYDGACSLREKLIEQNKVLHEQLQAANPEMAMSTTFTITTCGHFDLVNIDQAIKEAVQQRGFLREKVLRGEVVDAEGKEGYEGTPD